MCAGPVELFFAEQTREPCLSNSRPQQQSPHCVPNHTRRPRGDTCELHQTGSYRAWLSSRGLAPETRRRENKLRPKKTILCVDNNEQSLSVRTFLLETRGYRVIPALSSQHALEVVEQSIPGSIDLLLCDLLMPQMDGNELVRRAKQLHPCLPSMIVSGTVNAFDRAINADVFLPKGASSAAEMIERIRVLVARKRGPKKAIHPTITHKPEAPAYATAS